MKTLTFFKKENKKAAVKIMQKLDKRQLEKVIGGGDGTILTTDLKASDGKKHFEVTS